MYFATTVAAVRSTRNAFNFGSYGSASSISVLLTAALLRLLAMPPAKRKVSLLGPECDATDMFCFADDPMKSTVSDRKSIFLCCVFIDMHDRCKHMLAREELGIHSCFALLGMVVIQYYTLWIASMKSFPLRERYRSL